MTETLYGPWQITIQQSVASFHQRFVIEGSQDSDGIYSVEIGASFIVSGSRWTLTPEWSREAVEWLPSRIRKSMSFDVHSGLTITLSVDDGIAPGDGDYNDLVLICRSLDPLTQPMLSEEERIHFTIEESSIYDPSENDQYLPYVVRDK